MVSGFSKFSISADAGKFAENVQGTETVTADDNRCLGGLFWLPIFVFVLFSKVGDALVGVVIVVVVVMLFEVEH